MSEIHSGLPIAVRALTRTVRTKSHTELTLLDGVSFRVEPGELVAIIGGSGAGKTTLLDAVAGLTPFTSGSVHFGGVDATANRRRFRSSVGYVPQDDIIHLDLALAATLRYAAQLRLPSSASAEEIDSAVTEVMDAVGLAAHADVRVRSLSGGQRKRASIAVELLTRPQVFFLDEPTSGLDPVTSEELIEHLRHVADHSATVVFTTHSVDDLRWCDRIVFMARGGRLAFVGTLDEALTHFGVETVGELYRCLADPQLVPLAAAEPEVAAEAIDTPSEPSRRPAGPFRQWSVLTRRTFEILLRNPLTLAILIGSPAMIVGMLAVLFRPGSFDFADPSPSSMVQIIFWVVFGAFFFGLTYGLLQICTERPILRRENFVGLRFGAYLASKLTVLVPFLFLVVVLMLGVLRLLDRLPGRSFATYVTVGTSLLLCSIAALALGLLTSAAVGNTAQATLALPMLCFPAVLFSGAILPVHLMATAGAAFSTVIPSRWAFEAMGHDLGVRRILAEGGSPLGPPLLDSYGDGATSSLATYWIVLGVSIIVLLVATWLLLQRSTRRATR